MTAILSELSELASAVLTLPLQVLLDAALLAVRGLLHVPAEQGLLIELLPTYITPDQDTRTHRTSLDSQRSRSHILNR